MKICVRKMYIAPQTHIWAVHLELDGSTGFVTASTTNSEGQYISIKQHIEALHMNTSLIDQVLSDSTTLHTFFDGE